MLPEIRQNKALRQNPSISSLRLMFSMPRRTSMKRSLIYENFWFQEAGYFCRNFQFVCVGSTSLWAFSPGGGLAHPTIANLSHSSLQSDGIKSSAARDSVEQTP